MCIHMPYWFDSETVSIDVGGRPLQIETGRIAKQAAGAALVSYGDTVVLVTAVHSKPRPGIDFFPLTVDFVEKFAASGKIPGGFFKREGRLADREVLVSRFIDRSIRPLFADGYNDETQITATVLSADGENSPDIAAFIGASTALTLSEIPFLGPIAALRVGRIGGELTVNPTPEQLEESDIELIVAGKRAAIVMVEGGAQEVPEAEILEALKFGHSQLQPLLDAQEELQAKRGKDKIVVPAAPDRSALEREVRAAAQAPLDEAVQIKEKHERTRAISEIESDVIDRFASAYRDEKVTIDSLAGWEERRSGLDRLNKDVKSTLHDLRSELMRERVLASGVRIDGRGSTDIRPIACEVRCVPRPHGVALFTRGETQAIVSTTLGSGGDEQMIDGMDGRFKKQFLLHYNFPPFSVGEARPLRGPGRREVGHGSLAERAIKAVLPPHDEFPYTIRVVSETLESNGSSSMATVCGGVLSLLDAGVPLKAPVAGIAMGLIQDGERVAILSDILGDEDHLGDMDFKVAGSEAGITAVQMDIKVSEVDWDVMERALAQARDGRLHILKCMAEEAEAELPGLVARSELHQYAPRLEVIYVKPDRIRDIIGPGGKVIRAIQDTTQAKIDVEDSGRVSIFGPNAEAVAQAQAMVEELTQEAELGRVYLGKVKRITAFGAFAEIFPGIDLAPSGRIRLSRMEALADLASQES